ncbi:O-antigen ligase family protein [Campylobacter ureolyticus]|uniref:O antigen ligase family membrane protein n=1 Tax=Campylobacter ureolyticus TaxID=827 RepID=A0AAE7JPV4_9BACT|nr:O-antigen ligase family protein [Campylobacter ureolyticus]MCR8685002.1 O-antigen ligase family protein [Campylobacter ureolyticus]QKF84731.1 O antigen ligase family membrane protein [Campylobacter ureolyticus]QQY35100.1 O-antigen ligase family protein [Campylobacter ureolyticus]SUX21402.1 O-antigen polymerase family protein [Campylobacter ureolyticus]
MHEYLIGLKEDKYKLAFNIILFIWLCSIPFKNAIYQISTVLVLLFFVVHLIINKNYSVLIENFKKTKVLTVFIALILLSMCLANILNPELLAKKSWHYIIAFFYRYVLVFIALAYFYRLKYFDKKVLVNVFLFGLLFVAAIAIFMLILNPDTVYGGLKGTFDNRNAMGLAMSLGVVFTLFILKDNIKIGLVLLTIFGFCMLFSFSRSGWVASFVAYMVFYIFYYKKLDKRFFIIFGICILAVILLYLSIDIFQDRVNSLLKGNSSYRTNLWKFGLTQIPNNLFFGHGVSCWRNLNLPVDIAAHTGLHNSTLEILLFTGIFGLVAWISAVLTVFYQILKDKNYICLSLLVYFVVITQFDFSVFDSKELFSAVTIFMFLVYSDKFKAKPCK